MRKKEESGHFPARRNIITGNRFIDECEKFRIIEFGKRGAFPLQKLIEFRSELQPVFNKNFKLLTEKLISNKISGYRTFIISESQSQIDRLRDIFAEINPDVQFTPLLLNLHSGFTDNDLNISVYTDHQIFDRYHKFRIEATSHDMRAYL